MFKNTNTLFQNTTGQKANTLIFALQNEPSLDTEQNKNVALFFLVRYSNGQVPLVNVQYLSHDLNTGQSDISSVIFSFD